MKAESQQPENQENHEHRPKHIATSPCPLFDCTMWCCSCLLRAFPLRASYSSQSECESFSNSASRKQRATLARTAGSVDLEAIATIRHARGILLILGPTNPASIRQALLHH